MTYKAYKTKFRNKLVLVITLLGSLAFVSLIIFGFYQKEYAGNDLVNEKIINFDAGYFYDFYISSKPSILNRSYYGNGSAGIAIIAFLAPNSETSKEFIANIFPQIDKEFIKTGKAKFYAKYYATPADIAEGTDKFKYALGLLCAGSIKEQAFYPLYFDTFKMNTNNMSKLAQNYNIPKHEFEDCLTDRNIKEIIMDAAEIDNFGIDGASPRFYIGLNGESNTIIDGVPRYNKFRQTIRQYEFILGE